MRKADIVIGSEYAVGGSWFGAARVRVLALEPGARALVQVIEAPGTAASDLGEPGATVSVATRRLTTWDDWHQKEADRDRHLAAERAAALAAQAREGEIDPDRRLPATYETTVARGDRPYEEAFDEALGESRSIPVVDDALSLLPSAVQRDVVAAAVEQRDSNWAYRAIPYRDSSAPPAPPATRVGDVFVRAVWLAHGAHRARSRDRVIVDHDADFVDACVAAVAADGGVLEMPFVPRVPVVSGNRPSTGQVVRAPLGWVRLAYGDTTGKRLHVPSCSILKGWGRDDDEGPTMPLWQATLTESCGVCGGPGIMPTRAWVAFAAASDTWASRARATPEAWQVAALVHLLAEAAVARADSNEPDRTAAAVVLDALADDVPGDEGWAAYKLLSPFHQAPDAGAERDAAIALAYRRLRTLSDALGANRRPPEQHELTSITGRIRGGDTARVEQALIRWWRDLEDAAADVPGLELALFGLPGAIHSS